MLAIIRYIKENGLEAAVSEFKLKTREYDNKVLIKYDQIASMMGLEEVQDCRGLVLEKGTWKIMCLSFRKFFNNAEGHAAKIDWDTAHVLEKLDGSMIQVYWDWNKETWFAATTGTAEGEGIVNNKEGTSFNELFWNTVNNGYYSDYFDTFEEALNNNKNKVYVFELTTPYNIVVKPHGTSSATLLTVRDRTTLLEESYDDLELISSDIGVPLVKAYDMNTGNAGVLVKTFENMPWTDEGYVVVDAKHNRVKIKNPAYVAVHHLKSKTSEHAIMDVVKTNEIDEFVATFPDRKVEMEKLHKNYVTLVNSLENAWESIKDKRPKNITPKEKKRFAMVVFDLLKKEDLKEYSGMFFGMNDNRFNSVQEYMMSYDNKKLYKTL